MSSKTPSLSQAYSYATGIQSPADVELRMAEEQAAHLLTVNRDLESKLQLRTLALRQLLSLIENEVRHRTNLSVEIKNIRKLLGDE